MQFRPEKKLGFGLMRLPIVPGGGDADIDIEQLKKMVDLFIEKGFTYFDTAWMYNGFASENAAKEALVDRYPRESFTWRPSCTPASSRRRRTETRYSTSSLERQGRAISTITCCTASTAASSPYMRS